MTMPYYVAPEQVMKDRAEYAQKGIARGRSLVATTYDQGIAIVADNPSRSLHKISEIYDRIAFAGVGKYNEFDQLRVSGIRHADTKGYAYSREDVEARSLANLYAQYLGQVFTHEMKPLEVEILVAELGNGMRAPQLYHIAYEGTITDEDRFAVFASTAQAEGVSLPVCRRLLAVLLDQPVADAAAPAGVKVYKDEKSSDPYFLESDNLSLALQGVPAHTLCVAFDFPDYHKVSDSPDKIDYANMAAVDGAISLGLMRLASNAPPPKWNDAAAGAKPYIDARKMLQP